MRVHKDQTSTQEEIQAVKQELFEATLLLRLRTNPKEELAPGAVQPCATKPEVAKLADHGLEQSQQELVEHLEAFMATSRQMLARLEQQQTPQAHAAAMSKPGPVPPLFALT